MDAAKKTLRMIPGKSLRIPPCRHLDSSGRVRLKASFGLAVGCAFSTASRFVLQSCGSSTTSQAGSGNPCICVSAVHLCFGAKIVKNLIKLF